MKEITEKIEINELEELIKGLSKIKISKYMNKALTAKEEKEILHKVLCNLHVLVEQKVIETFGDDFF